MDPTERLNKQIYRVGVDGLVHEVRGLLKHGVPLDIQLLVKLLHNLQVRLTGKMTE